MNLSLQSSNNSEFEWRKQSTVGKTIYHEAAKKVEHHTVWYQKYSKNTKEYLDEFMVYGITAMGPKLMLATKKQIMSMCHKICPDYSKQNAQLSIV